MSEGFNVSGNLLFVKDSLIQFVSSGKQNVLSFRILIGISPAETLSEGSNNYPRNVTNILVLKALP